MSEDWAKANGCEVSYNWDAGETSYCASNANGTGPFKITLREQDVRTVFEKNDDWWGDDSTFNVDKLNYFQLRMMQQELQHFFLEKLTILMLYRFKILRELNLHLVMV